MVVLGGGFAYRGVSNTSVTRLALCQTSSPRSTIVEAYCNARISSLSCGADMEKDALASFDHELQRDISGPVAWTITPEKLGSRKAPGGE